MGHTCTKKYSLFTCNSNVARHPVLYLAIKLGREHALCSKFCHLSTQREVGGTYCLGLKRRTSIWPNGKLLQKWQTKWTCDQLPRNPGPEKLASCFGSKVVVALRCLHS